VIIKDGITGIVGVQGLPFWQTPEETVALLVQPTDLCRGTVLHLGTPWRGNLGKEARIEERQTVWIVCIHLVANGENEFGIMPLQTATHGTQHGDSIVMERTVRIERLMAAQQRYGEAARHILGVSRGSLKAPCAYHVRISAMHHTKLVPLQWPQRRCMRPVIWQDNADSVVLHILLRHMHHTLLAVLRLIRRPPGEMHIPRALRAHPETH
jgi:hypothetical protein